MDKLIEQTPHFHLIKKDEMIKLRSIFDFTGGCEELFSFLYACKKINCTVHFVNEDIVVEPDSDEIEDMRLAIYVSLAVDPKMAEDYARYVFKYIGTGERRPMLAEE